MLLENYLEDIFDKVDGCQVVKCFNGCINEICYVDGNSWDIVFCCGLCEFGINVLYENGNFFDWFGIFYVCLLLFEV